MSFHKIDITNKEVVILKTTRILYITILLYKELIYQRILIFNKTLRKYLKNKKRVNFQTSDFQKY